MLHPFLEDSDTVDSFDLVQIIYAEMRTRLHLCQYVNMPMCFCVKSYICKYVYCVHVDMYRGIYNMYIYVNTYICKNVHINVLLIYSIIYTFYTFRLTCLENVI